MDSSNPQNFSFDGNAQYMISLVGLNTNFSFERYVIIAFLFGIPPFTISLHTTLLYLLFFSSKKAKYTNIFYKLVMIVSLLLIYWSFYFIYQGFCHLLNDCPLSETTNIVLSSIAHYFFIVCMNMNLLIA